MYSIPQIDLQASLRGLKRRSTAKAIRKACLETGFFYVTNHGISEKLCSALFSRSQEFFALPIEEKMAVHMHKSGVAHRGYVPLFGENVNPGQERDCKESFDVGDEFPPEHPFVVEKRPLFGPNLWPQRPEKFRSVLEAYYEEMRALSFHLAELLALSLDLDEDFFVREMSAGSAALRILHYPPQSPNKASDETSCGEHTDYGLFTILNQDHAGGLEIRSLNGSWLPAPPIEGSFIINIADLLSRWTNDLYRSTEHRVRNEGGGHRYSVPYFVGANTNTKVECIPSCCSEDRPPRYEPVEAGAYLLARYSETFSST